MHEPSTLETAMGESFFQIVTFAVVGLFMIPWSSYPWAEYLPFTMEQHLLQEIMINGMKITKVQVVETGAPVEIRRKATSKRGEEDEHRTAKTESSAAGRYGSYCGACRNRRQGIPRAWGTFL
jgi:hypothetical protein